MAILDDLPARGGLLSDKGAARIRDTLVEFEKNPSLLSRLLQWYLSPSLGRQHLMVGERYTCM